MIRRLIAFGDDYGMPMLLRHLPRDIVAGMVAASIRPGQHNFLAQCSANLGVPLLVQPKRDSPDYAAFVEHVRLLAPEFLMVNSYSMRIGTEVLRVAPLGGVNVHGALLPRYRGANPVQWALIEDQRETGVTMHQLTEDIDAGAIVAQRKVPICFRDTWREVQDRIAQATEMLLSESMPAVLKQNVAAVPQNPAEARYYRRRNPEDGKIDWAKRVLDIYNLIRALIDPHPGAYYESPGGRAWIQCYMPIQEVAALKYSMLQKPPVTIGNAQYWPSAGRRDHAAADTFSLECNADRARLVDIDWEVRVAVAEIATSRKDHAVALERALIDFARDQLGLRATSGSQQRVQPER